MNPVEPINETVSVIPSFNGEASERDKCIPRRMKWRGREFEFTTFGMRHPTSKGKHMIHVLDMADEANSYRLEFDARTLRWTLVYIMEGRYV